MNPAMLQLFRRVVSDGTANYTAELATLVVLIELRRYKANDLKWYLWEAFEEAIDKYLTAIRDSSTLIQGVEQCEATDNAGIVNSLEEPLRMG